MFKALSFHYLTAEKVTRPLYGIQGSFWSSKETVKQKQCAKKSYKNRVKAESCVGIDTETRWPPFCSRAKVPQRSDDNVGFPASAKHPQGRAASLPASSFTPLTDRLRVDQLLNLSVRGFKLQPGEQQKGFTWLPPLEIFSPNVLEVPPSPSPEWVLNPGIPVETACAASALLPLGSHARPLFIAGANFCSYASLQPAESKTGGEADAGKCSLKSDFQQRKE